jgi:predicted DNA-binding protein
MTEKLKLYCVRLPADDLQRLRTILRGGENTPSFIREAVQREIERREALLVQRGTTVETFT